MLKSVVLTTLYIDHWNCKFKDLKTSLHLTKFVWENFATNMDLSLQAQYMIHSFGKEKLKK